MPSRMLNITSDPSISQQILNKCSVPSITPQPFYLELPALLSQLFLTRILSPYHWFGFCVVCLPNQNVSSRGRGFANFVVCVGGTGL